jgi:hypothetical protein
LTLWPRSRQDREEKVNVCKAEAKCL